MWCSTLITSSFVHLLSALNVAGFPDRLVSLIESDLAMNFEYHSTVVFFDMTNTEAWDYYASPYTFFAEYLPVFVFQGEEKSVYN